MMDFVNHKNIKQNVLVDKCIEFCFLAVNKLLREIFIPPSGRLSNAATPGQAKIISSQN